MEMAANQGPVSLGELAQAVVAADDELRNELKALVQDIIGHMRYTMRHGDPASKLSLAKSITPQLLTAINKVDHSEDEQARREAYNRMMAELRGEEPAA